MSIVPRGGPHPAITLLGSSAQSPEPQSSLLRGLSGAPSRSCQIRRNLSQWPLGFPALSSCDLVGPKRVPRRATRAPRGRQDSPRGPQDAQ
eukprot:7200072-Pyramimonas_sp.AAC.1